MTYIDGFVIAVPTANKQKFIDPRQKCRQSFRGARRDSHP
jgi:uncharacterized protein YbaA (DUF1428 family)